MIVIAMSAAILLAGCTASGSTDVASTHSSSSSRSDSASPAGACTDATVRRLVNQFVQAFNVGDLPTLQQLWAQQGSGFDWYSTDAPGQRIRSAAKDRAGLERYFTARHAAGESLRLTSFQYNGNTAAYGNFQYTLIRRADDLAPTAYTGKGAAICGSTRSMLGVWSMAKMPASRTSEPATPSIADLHRPLRMPHIRPDQPCPVTLSRHQPDPALGIVQGMGPAGPIGLSADGILHYVSPAQGTAFTDRSWGGQKILWAVDSTVNGPVLLRGRQLDGTHGLRFDDPAVTELLLAPKSPITPGGWRDYPSYTRLQAPGCYGYQVDAPSGSTVIIFRAEGPRVTP